MNFNELQFIINCMDNLLSQLEIQIYQIIIMMAKLQIAKGQSFAALGMFSEATTNLVSSSNQSITIA